MSIKMSFLPLFFCFSLSACGALEGVFPASKIEVSQGTLNFQALPQETQKALDSQYGGCLNSKAPLIQGFDSTEVLNCAYSVQGTGPNSEPNATPFSEDALRHDRTYLTERALTLTVKGDGNATRDIKTFSELKAAYAPVESLEEALGFVLFKEAFSQMLTQSTMDDAFQQVAHGSTLTLQTSRIQGTSVKQNSDGSYTVERVLFIQNCSAFTQNFRVTREGTVEKVGTAVSLFEGQNCPVE